MTIAFQPERAVARLGFWSAALVTFLTALFFISLVIPSQTLMYTSSFLHSLVSVFCDHGGTGHPVVQTSVNRSYRI